MLLGSVYVCHAAELHIPEEVQSVATILYNLDNKDKKEGRKKRVRYKSAYVAKFSDDTTETKLLLRLDDETTYIQNHQGIFALPTHKDSVLTHTLTKEILEELKRQYTVTTASSGEGMSCCTSFDCTQVYELEKKV